MRPVFIGGCGRSGTTLLGAMIGAHSDCLCVPESQFKIDVLHYFNNQFNTLKEMQDVAEFIENHWRFKIWGMDFGNIPSCIMTCADLLKWIIKKYGDNVGKSNPKIWVDHTPENIKYVTTLFNLYPDAKFIHIVRDGRAVASSVIPLDWGPNTIKNAALWWMSLVGFGLAAENVLGVNRVMRVKYEDIVLKTEQTLRQICFHLEIDYQPGMMSADGFKVPKYTTKQHRLIGEKPDINRVNSWEKKLSDREVEIFESLTGDFLNYLGYEQKFGLKSRKMSKMEIIFGEINNCKKLFINRILHKQRKKQLNNFL